MPPPFELKMPDTRLGQENLVSGEAPEYILLSFFSSFFNWRLVYKYKLKLQRHSFEIMLHQVLIQINQSK